MAGRDDTLRDDIHRAAQSDPERVYQLLKPGLAFKRDSAERIVACCPFHAETDGSFKVSVGGHWAGRWKCHASAGCGSGDVLAFAGKLWSSAFPETKRRLGELLGLTGPAEHKAASNPNRGQIAEHAYEAVLDGVVVGIHRRKDFDAEPTKEVWWEWAGPAIPLTDVPLYNPLPRDLWEAFAEEPVIITEGEKAADSLYARGVVALGTMGGASATPSETVLKPLVGRRVTLWADNDDAGRAHMTAIAKRLQDLGGKPLEVVWPQAPDKGDAADCPGDAKALNALLATATEVPRQWHRLSAFVGMDVLDKHVSDTAWLWPGMIPRGYLTALGGDTGIGKSLCLLYLTQAAAGVTCWPNGAPQVPGRRAILWLDGEGRQPLVRQRVAELRMDRSVYAFPGEDGLATLNLMDAECFAGLRDMIRRVEPALVVLDPFSGFHAEDGNSASINPLLVNLQYLAASAQVAMVCVHDRNKQDLRFGTPEMTLRDFRGSGVLVQRAVSVLGIDRPNSEDPAVRVNPLKNNLVGLAPPLGYRFAANNGGLEWVHPPERYREESETDRVEQWLVGELRQGAQSEFALQDAAKQRKFSVQALWAAHNRLHAVTFRNERGTLVWGLPATHIQAVGDDYR